jgi:energy-coupling factor transporter ATP-binding protein EcfA2
MMPQATVRDAVKAAILENRFIRGLSQRDADKAVAWANGEAESKRLLVVGETGSGKSTLVTTLWPLFKNPCNLCMISGRWPEWAQPMILDGSNLGLGNTREDQRIKNAIAQWPDDKQLLVTAYDEWVGLIKGWTVVRLGMPGAPTAKGDTG